MELFPDGGSCEHDSIFAVLHLCSSAQAPACAPLVPAPQSGFPGEREQAQAAAHDPFKSTNLQFGPLPSAPLLLGGKKKKQKVLFISIYRVFLFGSLIFGGFFLHQQIR